MNATEEKPQQINGLQDRPSSVHDRTIANDSGTESKSDTPLTQAGSRPVRYELVDKDGVPISLKSGEHKTFSSAESAAVHARYLWPDQQQDPDRSGKGWDIQAVQ